MKLRDILKDLQVLSASTNMEREITGICPLQPQLLW